MKANASGLPTYRMTTCYKNLIINELDVLRRLAPTEEAGIFKARQYAAAIKTLQELTTIRSIADLPLATKGDGLGVQIRKKIQYILEFGALEITPEARTKADALDVFRGIYGVGPKKAEDLIAEGHRTISDIRAALVANPKLLNRSQLIGLRYYDDLQERIPRAEMDIHAEILMEAKPAALAGVIVGSYRRGTATSGDIDMLLTCPSGSSASASTTTGIWLKKMVAALKTKGYLKEVLAQGDHKCLAVASLPCLPSFPSLPSATTKARRLDLLVIDPAEFPFAVLYFTGSDGFNVRMRSVAVEKGYTLNEHALTHVATGVSVPGLRTEKDIFAFLGLVWREPTERTGPDAVIPVSA